MSAEGKAVNALTVKLVLVGATAVVTDANSTTFNSIVAGGGANTVRVLWNGSNWVIG